jgi:sugar phosphate isomerase/epimerase
MENPITISTGLVYKLTNDRNEMIQKLREFSPDGIELSFAHPQFLFDFTINEENLKYLRTLKFNSIHAPWKNIIYEDSSVCRKVLEKIYELYVKINARNVVFHKGPEDDFKILRDFNFISSVENDDWRKGLNTPLQIDQELIANPNLKLTFDFAHALTVSSRDIPTYFTGFKDSIIQVHIAMLNRLMQDHYFLHKHDSSGLRRLIGMIPKNIPLVLECVAPNEDEVALVKEEINYIRSI